jgi:hypothetical protein
MRGLHSRTSVDDKDDIADLKVVKILEQQDKEKLLSSLKKTLPASLAISSCTRFPCIRIEILSNIINSSEALG